MSSKVNLYQSWANIDEIWVALQNYKNFKNWIESFLDHLFDLHDIMQFLLTSLGNSTTHQK